MADSDSNSDKNSDLETGARQVEHRSSQDSRREEEEEEEEEEATSDNNQDSGNSSDWETESDDDGNGDAQSQRRLLPGSDPGALPSRQSSMSSDGPQRTLRSEKHNRGLHKKHALLTDLLTGLDSLVYLELGLFYYFEYVMHFRRDSSVFCYVCLLALCNLDARYGDWSYGPLSTTSF